MLFDYQIRDAYSYWDLTNAKYIFFKVLKLLKFVKVCVMKSRFKKASLVNLSICLLLKHSLESNVGSS